MISTVYTKREENDTVKIPVFGFYSLILSRVFKPSKNILLVRYCRVFYNLKYKRIYKTESNQKRRRMIQALRCPVIQKENEDHICVKHF